LSWEDFCPQFIGLSRARVDALIGNLEEFGKTFFELSNIVRISPEAYRKVAKQIQGHSLQIGAELVPIVPENAARIRNAVNRLRGEVKDARHDARVANGDTTILMMRLESCFHRMYDLATDPRLSKSEHQELSQMLEWYNCQAERIEQALEEFNRLR